MNAPIPSSGKKRVIIIGGGFAGLQLARKLDDQDLQVVLLDKNNYHQFQPLFYQVATAGLEPRTISFPFRKVFQKHKNVFIRLTEARSINLPGKYVSTGIGEIPYDFLVISVGVDTNFFGNKQIQEKAMPMKSVSEALALRNYLIENYEKALSIQDPDEKQKLMNIVVVGGGPTGVEVSGTLAEMKKFILPKDYPELDFSSMKIHLLEGSPRLLNGMSDQASDKAKHYLGKLGVTVCLGTIVKDYDGETVTLASGTPLQSKTLVWAAGVTGNKIDGLPPELQVKGNRIRVDAFNSIPGYENVFALGDIAYMEENAYPKGHPQVAQVAIQQAKNLAENLKRKLQNKPMKPFAYKDLGSMATIGRNQAVVDLPFIKFQGFFAWIVWMFVHLMAILGVKNKIFAFINWAWSYFSHDQSLRLIIKTRKDS
jgi:NADH dehydrogenase